MKRNMLCHSNNQRDLRFDGFLDRFGCLVSGYIDGRCIWFCLFLGLLYISIYTTHQSIRDCVEGYILSSQTEKPEDQDARLQHRA